MTNMILDQGADWRRGWTYRNAAGALVDLTGATVRFQARVGGPEGTALIDLDNSTKGGITVGGASGTIDLVVLGGTSTAWTLPTTNQGSVSEAQSDGSLRTATGTLLVWALEATLNGGALVKLDEGVMVIVREIVR